MGHRESPYLVLCLCGLFQKHMVASSKGKFYGSNHGQVPSVNLIFVDLKFLACKELA